MRIHNRKALLNWFNSYNGTTNKNSTYVKVNLQANRQDGSPLLVFTHNNGIGKEVIASTSGSWHVGDSQIRKYVY